MRAELLDTLVGLKYVTGYSNKECAELELMGFVVTGRSRFGAWAKITDTGRDFLRSLVLLPGSDAGAGAHAGASYRGAAPRNRRIAATQARGKVVICPPTTALHVGGVLSMPVVQENQHKAAPPPSGADCYPVPLAPFSMKQEVADVTARVIQYGKSRRKGKRKR